jgi:hypothetical protein
LIRRIPSYGHPDTAARHAVAHPSRWLALLALQIDLVDANELHLDLIFEGLTGEQIDLIYILRLFLFGHRRLLLFWCLP